MKRSSSGGGKMRVRFVEFELEGGDETLQESLKAITSVVNAPKRAIPALKVVAPPSAETSTDEAAVEEEPEFALESEEPAKADRKTRGARTYPSPKVVALPEGKVTFVDYLAGFKEPSNPRQRYLLTLGYLKEVGVEEADADHVYTCFRKAGWPAGRADFSQPLRDLRVDQLVGRGEKSGSFPLNHLGIDAINKLKKE